MVVVLFFLCGIFGMVVGLVLVGILFVKWGVVGVYLFDFVIFFVVLLFIVCILCSVMGLVDVVSECLYLLVDFVEGLCFVWV